MQRILILIAVLISMTTHSQVSVGIKGGFNFSTVKYDIPDFAYYSSIYRQDALRRPYAGLFAEMRLSEMFSLGLETAYMGTGDETTHVDKSSSNNRYDNLYFPVHTKIHLSDWMSLVGGPYLGYLLGSKDKEGARNLKNMYKLDWGIHFGLEINIDSRFGIGLQYMAGLRDIIKNKEPYVYELDWYNRGLQLYFIYTTDLFKKKNGKEGAE